MVSSADDSCCFWSEVAAGDGLCKHYQSKCPHYFQLAYSFPVASSHQRAAIPTGFCYNFKYCLQIPIKFVSYLQQLMLKSVH